MLRRTQVLWCIAKRFPYSSSWHKQEGLFSLMFTVGSWELLEVNLPTLWRSRHDQLPPWSFSLSGACTVRHPQVCSDNSAFPTAVSLLLGTASTSESPLRKVVTPWGHSPVLLSRVVGSRFPSVLHISKDLREMVDFSVYSAFTC